MRNLRALLMLAVMALLVAPVAAFEGDWPALGVLAATTVVAGAAGLIGPRIGSSDHNVDRSTLGLLADMASAWAIVVVGAATVTWALAGATGTAALQDPLTAFFEATAGVTTAGLTMVSAPQDLTPTLQWWRSTMQFLGALGVVVFALTIAEGSGDRDDFLEEAWGEQPAEHPRRAIMLIGALTTGIAGLAAVGLWIAGDPPWRALNHGVTAAATGGYAITADSAAASSPAARVVLLVAVTVSAISFGTIWGTVSRQGPALWHRTQIRWGLGLLVAGTGAAVLANGGDAPIGGVVFNAVSTSATAGFSAGDAHRAIPTVALLTMMSMLIGGAAGSTAGGVKTARIAWLTKAAWRWLPQGQDAYDRSYRWDGSDVEPQEAARRVTGAGVLVGLWLVAALLGTLVLEALTGRGLTDAMFESVSALGGTGLSRGLTDASLPYGPKAVLCALMLLGRVEIVAFIALAVRAARRPAGSETIPRQQ